MPEHHRLIPRAAPENLAARRRVLDAARRSPAVREELLAMCRDDILFYVNLFVWTYNTDHVGAEVGPFITWPHQEPILREEAAHFLSRDVARGDVLWEKSRKQGATWMALILFDWCCLFHTWKKFLAISHTESAVDRAGDPDSLFWKVQFMHDHLPDWMLRGASKRRLGFNYPATHSSFNGTATTERSGVGGRATGILLDEFSKQQAAQEIYSQTADTGPRLIIGTHYGVGTVFHSLTLRDDIIKRVMHWTAHPEMRRGLYRFDPEKNVVEILDKEYKFPADYPFDRTGKPTGGPFPGLRSAWYDNEVRRRGNDRDVAMHLDIDPRGSRSRFFDGLLIRTLIAQYARRPDWVGELNYELDTARPLGLVQTPAGRLRLWLTFRADGSVPPGRYAVGCDVSQGTGATPSCATVLDAQTGLKVGEYANPSIAPDRFAVLAVALCRLFASPEGDPARLAWETPGPGLTFGIKVQELGFGNVFYREANAAIPDGKASGTPGWHNNNESKRVLLTDYQEALMTRQFVNPSEKALDECLDFQYNAAGNIEHGGEQSVADPSGARVNHGDRVIADALAWRLARGEVRRRDAGGAAEDEPPYMSLAWRMKHRRPRQQPWWRRHSG